MCYWHRESHGRREGASLLDQSVPPKQGLSVRPRWAAAIAAALVAVIVVAAMVFPSPTPAVSTTRADAVPAVPTHAIEQTSTSMDDGVPASTQASSERRAAGSHCHHDM